MGDAFRDDREKSQNLLLPSHLESMKEVYESLDKYNDGILKRADFLMALRTDSRVVDFIDMDAVKVAAAKQKMLNGISEILARDATVLQIVSMDIEKVGDSMTAGNKRHYDAVAKLIAEQQERNSLVGAVSNATLHIHNVLSMI